MKIPTKYKKMIGKSYSFRGNVFSRKISIEPQEFKVHDVRFGLCEILDFKTKKRYPTIEYLISSDSMKKKRWTKGFPIEELEIKKP